jgi:hypothetical protein
LADKAFRLWVWGLCYCQTHLTDGLIPGAAVASQSGKAAAMLVLSRLWEAREEGGFVVHDYLDWNDSRELVTKRQAEARGRMATVRQRRSRELHIDGLREHSPRPPLGLSSGSEDLKDKKEIQDPANANVRISGQERSSREQHINGTTDAELGERAGNFCRRYAELYQQHRKGARYLPKPALDWPKACELCAVWPDARLEMLAVVFLKCEEPFAQSGSRTIGQFAAMASWADGRLAEVEAGGE